MTTRIQQRNQAIEELLREGYKVREVAAAAGVSGAVVHQVKRAAGLVDPAASARAKRSWQERTRAPAPPTRTIQRSRSRDIEISRRPSRRRSWWLQIVIEVVGVIVAPVYIVCAVLRRRPAETTGISNFTGLLPQHNSRWYETHRSARPTEHSEVSEYEAR